LSPFCTDLTIAAAFRPGYSCAPSALHRGFPMALILHDLLLFSCLAAFVTGIVIAAASLL
jgi:hypothetical protein